MPLTFDQAMGFGRSIPIPTPRSGNNGIQLGQLREEERRNQELEKAARLQRQDQLEKQAYDRAEVHRVESDKLLAEMEAAADAEDWDSVERIGSALGRLGYGVGKEGAAAPQAAAPAAESSSMVDQAVAAGGSLFDRAAKAGKGALESVGGFLYPEAFSKPPDPTPDPNTAVGGTFEQASQDPFDKGVERAKGVLRDLNPGPGGTAEVRVPIEKDTKAKGVPAETRVDPRELTEYVVRAPDGSEVARISGAKMREQNRINFDRISSEMVNGIDDPDLQKDVRLAAQLVRSQNLPAAESKKALGEWIEHLSDMSASARNAALMARVQQARINISSQGPTGEEQADDYIKGSKHALQQLKEGGGRESLTAYVAIRELRENAAANNGVANAAATYKAARAIQGAGPLTDGDIRNLSPKDQTIGDELRRKLNGFSFLPDGDPDTSEATRLNLTTDEQRVMTQFADMRSRQVLQTLVEREEALHQVYIGMPESKTKEGFRRAVIGALGQIPNLVSKERWGTLERPGNATPKAPEKKYEDMTPEEQDAYIRKGTE